MLHVAPNFQRFVGTEYYKLTAWTVGDIAGG
jgi:hypothetical protein